MPFSKLAFTVLMASSLASAIPTNSHAAKAERQETSLATSQPIKARGYQGAASLGDAVAELLAPKNAYDPTVPDKCVVTISEDGGTACSVHIQCQQVDNTVLGDVSNPAVWSQCFLNGRQYFTDPTLGNYSVQFTGAGGVAGNVGSGEDGLNHPILQFQDIDNWEPIDVEKYANIDNTNNNGGNLCTWNTGFLGGGNQGHLWQCGIPTPGKDGIFGLSSNSLSITSGYTPGWCVFHITQYQKNEGGIGNAYAFSIDLTDAKGKTIGQIDRQSVTGPGVGSLSMSSNLPATLDLIPGAVDADAISFAYNGVSWVSGDPSHCKMGGYQGGDRQGDCGFTC